MNSLHFASRKLCAREMTDDDKWQKIMLINDNVRLVAEFNYFFAVLLRMRLSVSLVIPR
jgi:hypothetical protein